MKNYVQRGDSIDFVAGGAIASGAVVPLQHAIGIALGAIASGATGQVAVEGVYVVPKVSAAVFAVGEKLIWDASAAAFDDSSATPAAGDLTGAAIAVIAGANTQLTCTVKLTPGNVTRT